MRRSAASVKTCCLAARQGPLHTQRPYMLAPIKLSLASSNSMQAF